MWFLLACSQPAPTPTAEKPPEPQGRLLWVIQEDHHEAVAVHAGPDAKDPQVVVRLDGSTFPGPADPKGTHALLVHSVGEGPSHLETAILVPFGGEPIQLGPAAAAVRNPVWTPDGERIVYESSALSFRDLYTVDRKGRVPKRLTETEKGCFDPSVGPDGRIAYACSETGNTEIYSMNADGTDQRQLTHDPGGDSVPRWAPDGRTLTWLARRGPKVAVWRMDPDGSHAAPFRFEPGPQLDRMITWSPDARMVAVTTQLDPTQLAIDLLTPDGKLFRRIQPKGISEHPTWSPDGRWVLFNTAPPNGKPELYRVRVDAPDAPLERLTTNDHPDWLARWGP